LLYYTWLSKSNDKFFKELNSTHYSNWNYDYIKSYTEYILDKILKILIRDPLADYFWFTYDGDMTYTTPNTSDTVPGNSAFAYSNLRIDSKLVKPLLRDIKISSIL